MFFLFDNLSCFRINSHISKIISIQSLVGKMKLEMSIFGSIFKNQAYLVNNPTYIIQYMQSFDCLVFWKQKLTRCKIKIAFFMVLCVNLNLWSWLYLLMVRDKVSLYEIKKKQDAQVKTRCFIKKHCFFWAPILSAYIIISSLIYEATTLMKNLFKFFRAPLISSNCLLD
jgi:hypothetical protein